MIPRTISYGTDPAQVVDLLAPAGPPRELLAVVVHGGFWRAAWDRGHARPQAAGLADAGCHVALVEYRRTGMPGGGWPGTGQDVAAAIAAVRRREDLPTTAVLVGHSAGGHLVGWAAAQPWAEGLAGAVSIAGCLDLTLVHELALGAGAAEAFLGAPPQADPPAWRAADPAHHPPRVPIALVHGEDDTEVPLAVSISYADAVRRDSPRHEPRLTVVPGCGHYEPIEPGTEAFGVVLGEVGRLAGGG